MNEKTLILVYRIATTIVLSAFVIVICGLYGREYIAGAIDKVIGTRHDVYAVPNTNLKIDLSKKYRAGNIYYLVQFSRDPDSFKKKNENNSWVVFLYNGTGTINCDEYFYVNVNSETSDTVFIKPTPSLVEYFSSDVPLERLQEWCVDSLPSNNNSKFQKDPYITLLINDFPHPLKKYEMAQLLHEPYYHTVALERVSSERYK